MDKGTGQLNEAFEKGIVGSRLTARQPQLFQNIVCLKIQLPVEANKVPDVVGVILTGGKIGQKFSDAWGLLAQERYRKAG